MYETSMNNSSKIELGDVFITVVIVVFDRMLDDFSFKPCDGMLDDFPIKLCDGIVDDVSIKACDGMLDEFS